MLKAVNSQVNPTTKQKPQLHLARDIRCFLTSEGEIEEVPTEEELSGAGIMNNSEPADRKKTLRGVWITKPLNFEVVRPPTIARNYKFELPHQSNKSNSETENTINGNLLRSPFKI